MKLVKIVLVSLMLAWSFASPAVFASTDAGQPKVLPDFTNTYKKGDKDVIESIQARLGRMLALAFQAVAVLSILPIAVGGLQLISSQGNSDKVDKGKKTLFWGVVGLVLALSGVVIFNVLLSVLTRS